MTFHMDSKNYMEYIKLVSKKITESKDYVTEIDAATGDGDHWVNMNMGFTAIANSSEELENLKLSDMFKKIGKNFISVVGGSSGVLYGSAYLEAAKLTAGASHLTPETLRCAGGDDKRYHAAWKRQAWRQNNDRFYLSRCTDLPAGLGRGNRFDHAAARCQTVSH